MPSLRGPGVRPARVSTPRTPRPDARHSNQRPEVYKSRSRSRSPPPPNTSLHRRQSRHRRAIGCSLPGLSALQPLLSGCAALNRLRQPMGATVSPPRPALQPAQLRVRFHHSNLEAERPGGVAGRRNDPRRPQRSAQQQPPSLGHLQVSPRPQPPSRVEQTRTSRRPQPRQHTDPPTMKQSPHAWTHNDNSIIDGEWIADSGYYRQDGPTGTVVPT